MSGAEDSKSLRATTWILTLLACAAFELARVGLSVSIAISWGEALVAIALATISAQWLARSSRRTPFQAVLIMLGVSLAPAGIELFTRLALGSGNSPEVLQLAILRSSMLALTACAIWPAMLRLAVAISLFLVLGSVVLEDRPAVYVAALLYSVVGIWWLLGAHWEKLEAKLATSTRRELPAGMRWGSLGIAILVALVGLALVRNQQTAYAMTGWFWGSGGSESYDVYAARGVGDGDALVAATDDARSFGAVESELFLDSEEPSLYDMFNDMYGEPHKTKQSERAVALAGPNQEKKEKSRMAKSEDSGREFSTVRQPRKRSLQQLADREDAAVMKVIGRVPLHVRLQTFDQFDGTTWTERSEAEVREILEIENDLPLTMYRPTLTMNMRDGMPWIEVHRSLQSPAAAPAERHKLQILHLTTSRIPTPVHTTAVHIDKVDQRDFFSWTSDDCLKLEGREKVPPLTVIHLRSQTIAPHLAIEQFLVDSPKSTRRYLTIPATVDREKVQALVDGWCKGRSRGYAEIEWIIEKLRENCIVDPDAKIDPKVEDVVGELLLRSHCGHDYQVATAAAILLRMRGYPARLATGFYAREDRYDASKGLTPVLPFDTHVWVEVCLDGWTWTTVDPSPEHPPLGPPRTLAERMGSLLIALLSMVRENAGTACMMVAATACATYYWRFIADMGLLVMWRLSMRGSSRSKLLATARLIECRAQLACCGRPIGRTMRRWLLPIAESLDSRALDSPGATSSLNQMLELLEPLMFAPAATAEERLHGRDAEVTAICDRFGRAFSLARLLRHVRETKRAASQGEASSTNAAPLETLPSEKKRAA